MGINIHDCKQRAGWRHIALDFVAIAIPSAIFSEVRIVERLSKEIRIEKKLGGGLKDRPQCERCGRPVKISKDDYYREEILCTHCAAETSGSDYSDYESA